MVSTYCRPSAAAGALWLILLAAAPAGAGQSLPLQLRPSDPNPSEAGQAIVVFADLETAGTPAPTGTLTIGDGTDSCTATLPQNYCVYRPGSSGSKTLSAHYSGDANYAAASSAAISHQVAPAGYPRRLSMGTAAPNFRTPAWSTQARSISDDNRYVAFTSYARHFIPHDGSQYDVFVFDRVQRRFETVSRGLAGAVTDGDSLYAVISGNGRQVAFESKASNLVAGDGNGWSDVFAYDRDSGTLSLISADPGGAVGNGASTAAAISADGRYVVFASYARNLTPNAPASGQGVYRRDRQLGITQLIAAGERPSISADGDLVAFESAVALLPGDTNGRTDAYLYRASTQELRRISNGHSGAEANGDSRNVRVAAGGLAVAFDSDANNLIAVDGNGVGDVFVHRLDTGVTTRASVDYDGNPFLRGSSYDAAISADGSVVAFTSSAGNLPPLSTTLRTDVLRRNLAAGTTERVNIRTDGSVENLASSTAAGITADGSAVIFNSSGLYFDAADSNEVPDPFLRDGATTAALITLPGGSQGGGHSINGYLAGSAETGYLVFTSRGSNFVAGDEGSATDIFVRSMASGEIHRASLSNSGEAPNASSYGPTVTPDGRYASFFSYATNLEPINTGFANYEVFLRDLQTQSTSLVSQNTDGSSSGNGLSQWPRLSDDGRFVAFYSDASNLVVGDNNGVGDIFVRDRLLGQTRRVSVSSSGVEANAASWRSILSADGSLVAFESAASNLVAGDTNGVRDVFVHDLGNGSTVLLSRTAAAQGNGASQLPDLSRDGRYLVFHSDASNLVAGDTNGLRDVFLLDRQSGSLRRVSVASNGSQGDQASDYGSVSTDGRYVAFRSDASNLVPGDSNGKTDIFVHDLATGFTARASVDRNGVQADDYSDAAQISWDGRYVVFQSPATNLVAGDSNSNSDIFLARNPLLPRPTRTQIIGIAPEGSVVGQSYLVGVAVDSEGEALGGSVAVSDDSGASCSATLSGGTGSCALAARRAGTRSISAQFSAPAGFASSSASATQSVARADTRASFSASSLRLLYGQTLSLSGQVTANAPSTATPTGTVRLLDGIAVLAEPPLADGAASVSTNTLAPGLHALSLRYPGNSDFNASDSAVVQVQVLYKVALSAQLLPQRDYAQGGSVFSYSVIVRNQGPHAASNAVVTSAAPAQLANVQWTCTALSASCAAAGSGDLLQTVQIQPGGSVSFVVTGTVQADPELPLALSATVSAAADAGEEELGDNSAGSQVDVGLFRDGFDPR